MRKVFVVFAAIGLGVLLIPTAALAAPLTGQVGPTIYGSKADLNGDKLINSGDTWIDFYGFTDVLNGGLDCDNWGATPNAGNDGDNVIDFQDDCILIGYDGSADGVTITVQNGQFVERDGVQIADGTRLPTLFNAASPANPSVAAADFVWNLIGGAVDVNQNSIISANDCTFNITNGWDILASLAGCGGVPDVDDGKVDVSRNGTIGQDDDSPNGFFGFQVIDGVVQGSIQQGNAPTIDSFTPGNGPIGTVVTINGNNFTAQGAGTVTVEFDGVKATNFTVDSNTKITATVPQGATDGTIKVTTGNGSATSTGVFDVTGTGGGATCTQTGTGGNDTLTGTDAGDVLCGKAGNDTLKGKAGDDLLKGGPGADLLRGGPGFDTCKGGKGNDKIKGCEA
jgi:hypothetical protein